MLGVQQKERNEMELNDKFYDAGIDLGDAEFDAAEDGHLEEASEPEFNMPDYVNELMAGIARL